MKTLFIFISMLFLSFNSFGEADCPKEINSAFHKTNDFLSGLVEQSEERYIEAVEACTRAKLHIYEKESCVLEINTGSGIKKEKILIYYLEKLCWML